MKKIKSALISVFYKDGLDKIVNALVENNVTIYSTGGTLSFIESLGHTAIPVEDLTSYPSILGGRVKTLHPKVFGGILARRENPTDLEQLEEYAIPEIDLVIVDLYPFEETVKSGAEEAKIIEKIDIGGISLIRAGAKNHKDVLIVASVDQYGDLLEIVSNQNCETSLQTRRNFAAKAFAVSSHYDSAIFNYFNATENIEALRLSVNGKTELRYGENPHQQAAFYGDLSQLFDKIWGKDISYNNMLDIEAAVSLISEFSEPTFAILKHNNACGVASRSTILDAWNSALACDPVSAFGGVLIANGEVDEATAQEINKLFFEVIIAPSYSEKGLEILKSKKNRIILIQKECESRKFSYRSMLCGISSQQSDSLVGGKDSEPVVITEKGVTPEQLEDLIFANIIVKHSKSNAIVFAKDKTLISSGIGQTSRVDALRQAIAKAKSFEFELKGAALASDAFFPFADCVEIAYTEGVECVIQPGGSIRDNDSVEYCNNNNMAMVFTSLRHFKH
ncbi:MAG: bifunctional phosphoribosylaminoimidazolecarboxamide formyltransferase/IMP cyclohydrolase [Rikenellaceae bacterium]